MPFFKKLLKIIYFIFGCARSSLLLLGLSLVLESGSCSLAVVHRLLSAGASLAAEQGLEGARASAAAACGLGSCDAWAPGHRLNSCGARVQLPCSTWYLPRPRMEPHSPAIAGGFFTTEPPGKPLGLFLIEA